MLWPGDPTERAKRSVAADGRVYFSYAQIAAAVSTAKLTRTSLLYRTYGLRIPASCVLYVRWEGGYCTCAVHVPDAHLPSIW